MNDDACMALTVFASMLFAGHSTRIGRGFGLDLMLVIPLAADFHGLHMF